MRNLDAVFFVPHGVSEPDFKKAENLDQAVRERKKYEKEVREDTLIRCKKGHFTRTGDAVITIVSHYVEPYSCTGGDYWVSSGAYTECGECGRKTFLDNYTLSPRDDKYSGTKKVYAPVKREDFASIQRERV